MRFVPFIRFVGLNGSLVRGADTSSSDVDILIVAKKTRLYTVRAIATFLIHLTGFRRHGKKTAGRVCLNCYLSSENLLLSGQNKNILRDIARAYKYMIPLVDDGISDKFFKKNDWIDDVKIKGDLKFLNYSRRLKSVEFEKFPLKPARKFERLLSGKIGDYLEKKMMKYQKERIFKKKVQGDLIVASVSQIKLHPKKSSK